MSRYEEGGWGWIVLIAAFVSQFIIYGNLKALGVLADDITREFDTELWLTGWMVSLSLTVQFILMVLLYLPLLRMLGYRPVMLFAGVMATAGYVLASLSGDFNKWSVFIVLFAGIGSGCFMYPLFCLLATYFKRYYPLSVFLSDLGMSCGTLLYGPMTQVLLDTYGWRWAMMILAGLTFHLVPCAAVAKASKVKTDEHEYQSILQASEDSADTSRPTSNDPKPEDNRHCCRKILAAFDLSIFTDPHFVLLTAASSMVAFCFVGWAVYVVPHGIKQGLSPMQSSFLPTSFGVGNVVGKLVAIILIQMELIGLRWIMCFGALLAGSFFIVDPFMTSFASLLLVTMAIGTGNAICSTVKITLYRDLTSDDRLLIMYSWSGLFLGLSDALAGFTSGWLFDVTGSFTTTFIMFGVVQFLAVIFMLIDIFIALYKNVTHDP